LEEKKIYRILFEHDVVVSKLTPAYRIHSVSGKLIFYSGGQSEYQKQKGYISGMYIGTRNLQHSIDNVLDSPRPRIGYDFFRVLFNTAGTLSSEVASICTGSCSNSGRLIIDIFILDPGYRHMGIGIEAIQEMVRNYAKNNCAIAINIEPAQVQDLSWRFSDLPEESERRQQLIASGLIVDLTEFEKLTYEESHKKLLTHFENVGFRSLKETGILMVANQLDIL
jgi:hypothetical protein